MALRLIDLEGNHYAAEATTSIDEELNSDSILSIVFQSTRTNERFISNLSEMWRVSGIKGVADDTEYVINFLSRKGIGNKMIAHVRAIPKMFDDLTKVREYERFDQSFTAFNFFTLVFKDTPYNFVLLDSFDALQFEGVGEGDSKLEMFIHGINRFGIEFEIVGNEVRMKKRVERDMPYQLRWRLNASNIQEEIDATGFATYAKGYGDYGDGEGGEDWQSAKLIREYTSPLSQIPGIGLRHAEPIKNGNIITESTMDESLKELVDSSIKISVTVDFHRLKNYPYAEPKKGDLIHLIDERINFKRQVRVINVLTYRDSKGKITSQEVRFGDLGVEKRHQAKINATINTVDRIMGGREKIPFNALDEAVLAATRALQYAQTELIFPESGGIHAVDKTNPNKMVVYNSAGLGISDDGGMTFKTAITGDGIVADVITAGVLRGIDIIGARIMSFNPVTNDVITLENGVIETFESGDKTFEVNSKGLTAFSRNTGSEVGTFRTATLVGDEDMLGLNIMGWADYLSIGKHSREGVSHPQLGFNWYGDYDRTYLFGGVGERNSGELELRATRSGGTAGYKVPHIIIDNKTVDGTAWSGVRAYIGRDNRSPASSNFRSGLEVWQYKGDGKGGIDILFQLDTHPNGDKYIDAWVDAFYVAGKITADKYIYTSVVEHLPYGNGVNLYLRPYNEVRITAPGTTDDYHNLRAHAVLVQSGILEGATQNHAQIELLRDGTGQRVRSASIHNRSYSGSANMYITSAATLGKITSARKYKLLEKPINVDPYKILKIIPKTWYDKSATEAYANYLANSNEMNLDEEDIPTLRRIPGAVAEDFVDAGLELYVTYDEKGEVESLMYDRAWMPLIPITSDHEDRLNEYDKKIIFLERKDKVKDILIQELNEKVTDLTNEVKKLKGVA